MATEAFEGVIVTDCRLTGAAVTVSVVEAETPLSDAEIVVLPAAMLFARPALLMVATDPEEEPHVALLETFLVVPSE